MTRDPGQADDVPEPDARRRQRSVGSREEHDRRRARTPPPAGRPDRHRDDAGAASREIDGVHYHFLSDDEFAELRDNDGLLEHANNHGHWYGTPIDQIRGILAAGRDAILTISPEGALNVRRLVPDALLIFVMPPSMEALTRRLQERGSESEASLERRRRDAERWMAQADEYDHVVVNETGHPEQAAELIWEIIQAEARRDPPRRPRI